MIKGIYNIQIEHSDGPIINKIQSNLILNNGLKSIITGSPWSNSNTSVAIGSSDQEPTVDQTNVLTPLGSMFSGNGLLVSGAVGSDSLEYIKVSYAFQAKEHDLNGPWAELSIPNFNRIVLSEIGLLDTGLAQYGMTSRNNVGESHMSFIDQNISTSGTSIRIDFDPALNQINNTTSPSEYILYKNISGTYSRVGSVPSSSSNRYYFYDRGEFQVISGTYNPSNTAMNPPNNLRTFETTDPSPRGFVKNELMKISIRIDIYIGNKDLLIP